VSLTPAGRRLYTHARPLVDAADKVTEVMVGLRHAHDVIHLAASHSATEALVGGMLASLGPDTRATIELVTANSQVVRGMVADGRADIGIAASRPGHTPYPGVRERVLAADAVVCAVPPGHPWTGRTISVERFVATPMVVRDPSSNARWTVDEVLRARELRAAPPLAEVATPAAALAEARRRRAPVLVSRHIVAMSDFTAVEVDELEFARSYVLVTPAYGEPTGDVRALIERIDEHVAIWLR
jgi:DNA-binding transcriptional LysR family regulator